MEVVRAELYCVHSMMEYIKINLHSEEELEKSSNVEYYVGITQDGCRCYPMTQESTNCPTNS